MTTTLIFGASGYLGRRLFLEKWTERVVGTYYNHQTEGLIYQDLQNTLSLIDFIREIQPGIILYAAGLTDVDECQKKPEKAFFLNYEAVKEIMNTCIDAKFIYFSTDYVFDGKLGKYDEYAPPRPINVYGQSKLLGEQIVLSKNPNNVVIRIGGLFGENGNQNSRFRKLISSSGIIFAEDDRISSPIHLDEVVSATKFILSNNFCGLFHASGNTSLSRYEFQQLLFYHSPSPRRIIPTYNFPRRITPRPPNTSLVSKRLNAAGWFPKPTTQILREQSIENQQVFYKEETVIETLFSSNLEAIVIDTIGGVLTKRTWLSQDDFLDRIDCLCGELDDELELLPNIENEDETLDNVLSGVIFRYVPNPSIWSCLQRWHKKYKLALVNEGLAKTFRMWVNNYGLEDIFDVILNSSELGLRKSNSEFYRHLAGLLNVSTDKCLVIDDNATCLKSAIQAGMKTIQTFSLSGYPLLEHQIVKKNDLKTIILQIIRFTLNKHGIYEEFHENSSLREMGLDSLEILSLLLELEKVLNIQLEEQLILDDIDKLSNLSHICLTHMRDNL